MGASAELMSAALAPPDVEVGCEGHELGFGTVDNCQVSQLSDEETHGFEYQKAYRASIPLLPLMEARL